VKGLIFAFETGIVQRENTGRDVSLARFVLIAPEQPLRYCVVTSLVKGMADGFGGVLVALGEKCQFEMLSRLFIRALEVVGVRQDKFDAGRLLDGTRSEFGDGSVILAQVKIGPPQMPRLSERSIPVLAFVRICKMDSRSEPDSDWSISDCDRSCPVNGLGGGHFSTPIDFGCEIAFFRQLGDVERSDLGFVAPPTPAREHIRDDSTPFAGWRAELDHLMVGRRRRRGGRRGRRRLAHRGALQLADVPGA